MSEVRAYAGRNMSSTPEPASSSEASSSAMSRFERRAFERAFMSPEEIYRDELRMWLRYLAATSVSLFVVVGIVPVAGAGVAALAATLGVILMMALVTEVACIVLFAVLWWISSPGGKGNGGGIKRPSAPVAPRSPVGVG